jgi:hypothetical protein
LVIGVTVSLLCNAALLGLIFGLVRGDWLGNGGVRVSVLDVVQISRGRVGINTESPSAVLEVRFTGIVS